MNLQIQTPKRRRKFAICFVPEAQPEISQTRSVWNTARKLLRPEGTVGMAPGPLSFQDKYSNTINPDTPCLANFQCRSATASTLQRAFTLVELLVVISIIVVIAALLIPAGAAMVRKSNIQRAISERDQIETAIDAYKAKYGFYPPSNGAGMPLTNQLYYELLGTTLSVGNSGSNFTTLDNASVINGNTISSTYFVGGFLNSTKPGGGEDSIPATTFLAGLKAGEIASNGPTTFLVTAANSDLNYQPMPGVNSLAGRPANPWRYVCPGTNNPSSYDLWVQVFVGNKSNLICNWTKNPQINVELP